MPSPKIMQKSQSNAPKGGFDVQDVVYVLFRHKWMILLLSALGFGLAAALFLNQEPIYTSQSKLWVESVFVRGSDDPYQTQGNPGAGPMDSKIRTEIEILMSLDLAKKVAENIGVEVLLPEAGGNASVSDAAGKILAKLEVGVGQSNNVLRVVYGNRDPALAKVVLKELMDRYLESHLDIHGSGAAFDMVEKQTEEVFQRLKETEKQLNTLRTESGILSLADAISALSSQRAKTHEDLMNARASFAEQQANIESLEKSSGARDEAEPDKVPNDGKEAKPKGDAPPQQAITEYRTVMELLAFLQKRDLELRIKFKSGNRLLTINQEQLGTYEARRKALVAKYPDLAVMAEAVESDPGNPKLSWIAEKARLAAISAKIEVFENHLKEIGQLFTQQYTIGAQIEEMERRKQMEDIEYRTLATKLKNAKLEKTLDPSRMQNIRVIEHPTEPIRTFDEKVQKVVLGLAGGGMALGVGLAFLIELLLDRRIKRPIEIQTRLQLPLLLSIPFIRKKERGGMLLARDEDQPRIGMGEELTIPQSEFEELGFETPARKMGHFILPYSETIRDRIIFNFEVNNVTHKPKLVAVTGLSEGAGASTIAAGLAKSFSEIPGMKVLLVDLSSYHPEDNPLFGEIPRHTLNGALHLARNTQFKDNPQSLYYASATARRDDSGLTTFSPVHLYELMPNLQASQYDYIVFDMPPIDQTSRTLTMAGLMDKVLLVLDAEHTSRDGLLWGYSELVKGRADVSCIFNKSRSVTPGWLSGGN